MRHAHSIQHTKTQGGWGSAPPRPNPTPWGFCSNHTLRVCSNLNNSRQPWTCITYNNSRALTMVQPTVWYSTYTVGLSHTVVRTNYHTLENSPGLHLLVCCYFRPDRVQHGAIHTPTKAHSSQRPSAEEDPDTAHWATEYYHVTLFA